jgi:hypothetical protein
MGRCGENFNDDKYHFTDDSRATASSFPPNFFLFPGAPLNCLNPGTISNLHKKVRNLTPEWIEGLKLRCVKNLDVDKTFYSEWRMGNNTPLGFCFGGIVCKKDNDSITVSNFA